MLIDGMSAYTFGVVCSGRTICYRAIAKRGPLAAIPDVKTRVGRRFGLRRHPSHPTAIHLPRPQSTPKSREISQVPPSSSPTRPSRTTSKHNFELTLRNGGVGGPLDTAACAYRRTRLALPVLLRALVSIWKRRLGDQTTVTHQISD